MHPDERLNELLNLVLSFARREFDSRVEVGYADAPLEHLALALNMLGEELGATTAAKEALDALTDRLGESIRELEAVARLDPLTHQLNRRGMEACLVSEAARAHRDGDPLTAVLIDIDDFKDVNDRLGHAVGDVVLREVARRLVAALRSEDHLARVGGDEFLALLPRTRFCCPG